MQLIDKRKLISDVESISAEYGNDNSSLIEQGDVLDLIEEAPTVDAIPVVSGRWIVKHFGDDAQCSECGWSFSDAYDADSHDRFCRHCGAEMGSLVLENKKVKSKTVYCGAIDCDDLTCDRNMENLLAMSVDDEVIIKSLQKTCRTYINKLIEVIEEEEKYG